MTAGRKSSRARHPGPITGAILAVISIASAVLIAALTLPGHAAADQAFRIEFDDNQIELGPVGNIPIGQLSRSAAIEGTVDSTGRVTVPKGKFTLPVLGIDTPVSIRGFMGIEDEATGTWDPATGRLEIDARAGIWLSVNVSETLRALGDAGITIPNLGPLQFIIGSIGQLTCGFSPMDVTFTTETTSFGSGQRFTRGLKGPGSLTAGWSQLGPFAGRSGSGGFLDINPIACPLIRSALPGLLSGLVGNAIPGLDLGDFDIAGLLDNLDSVNLGPSSLTISRQVDQSIPASLALRSGPVTLRAKAGKAVRVPIGIRNPGEAPATGVKACPRLPRSSRTGGRCVNVGSIAPGRTVSRSLLLKPARSAVRSGRGRKGSRGASTRTVRFSIVVTGDGLPSQVRGMTLRIVG